MIFFSSNIYFHDIFYYILLSILISNLILGTIILFSSVILDYSALKLIFTMFSEVLKKQEQLQEELLYMGSSCDRSRFGNDSVPKIQRSK